MNHNDKFMEHLSDHLIIAFSFFSLGVVSCSAFMMYLFNKKLILDYDIEKGTVMRLRDVCGKKWLIVRPASMMQFYDAIFLAFFDKGKEKIVDMHGRRRVRIITVITSILVALLILSGLLLVLSAVKTDINVLNYLFDQP